MFFPGFNTLFEAITGRSGRGIMEIISMFVAMRGQGQAQPGSPEFTAQFQENIVKAVADIIKLANNKDFLNSNMFISIKKRGMYSVTIKVTDAFRIFKDYLFLASRF